jgi:hypothetical protein
MSSKLQRGFCLAALLAELQVLVHRELGKDVAVLGHVADAAVGDVEGLLAEDLLVAQADRALAVDRGP